MPTMPTGQVLEISNDQKYRIRIIGLSAGERTPIDGEYVVAYDPGLPGSPQSCWAECDLVTSPDPLDALPFDSGDAALRYYLQSHGIRSDGQPNRPLSAYTVEIAPGYVRALPQAQ